MAIPTTRIKVYGRSSAQVGPFVPPALPDLGLGTAFVADHRWAASRIDPRGVGAVQSIPDAAASSGDPMIRLQPTGNDVGSPETVLLADDTTGVPFLRCQGVNFQASQYDAAGRSWWAVFRWANINNNAVRLGGGSFGRHSTGAARILLPGSLRLTAPVATKDRQWLVMAACLDDAPNALAGNCLGSAMTFDVPGTYTRVPLGSLQRPATTVTAGSNAAGSKTLDLVECGTGLGNLTPDQLNTMVTSLMSYYAGLVNQ